jgi:hypothetical protein
MALDDIAEWCGRGPNVTEDLERGRRTIYCHEHSADFEEKVNVSSSGATTYASLAVRDDGRLKWEDPNETTIGVDGDRLEINSGPWEFRITPK